MYRWTVESELVPVTAYQPLATVRGLNFGRTAVVERARIQLASDGGR
jgi:hypothetical protein